MKSLQNQQQTTKSEHLKQTPDKIGQHNAQTTVESALVVATQRPATKSHATALITVICACHN